jgi:chemotaxis protein MotA
MVVLIGYAVAMGCIFGAYIIHGGNIGVILHALPTELMAILGGSLGAFAVNNQPKVLKATLAAIPGVLKGSKYSKARYMELMALLYDILQKARKEGLMAIEKDVEDPAGSSLFQKYAVVGSDHHVVEFITDYLRMMVSGNLNAHEIESLMDSEIETHHAEAHGPVNALGRLAGALPAFGIVAAVLGVVNTMGSVGQPPAILGGMIGSALVGTFLGILLAYAVVEPLGGLIEQKVDEGSKELQCIKTTLLASMQGYAPQVAVEFGRKVLYSKDRPTFSELEGHVKGKDSVGGEGGRRSSDGAAPWWRVSEVHMAGDSKKLQPIIIKRVRKGGHNKHGGAWKIAYADFVTAMMAFFLLMWLLGSTTEGDKKGIADFFNAP